MVCHPAWHKVVLKKVSVSLVAVHTAEPVIHTPRSPSLVYEYKVPFLYDIRRALHLPLQGSQLLMFVWSKLTSYAAQNLSQIVTALKSLISRTLETYRPSTDPIYLLLCLTSVIDQTIHLRPPHVIDGKIVFDQLLVTLSRYFTSADALGSSKGWHSMVAKILDARSNNKAYNADILDYAKF